MDLQEYVAGRVERAYHDDEINCAQITLGVLSEVFSVPIEKQLLEAAIGMNGAGQFRAQCGLVEGAVMFIGVLGTRRGLEPDAIGEVCRDFAGRFQSRFGPLLCRDLRPEGFAEENPPHLCEPRSVEAIVFSVEFVSERFDLEIVIPTES